MLYQVYTNLYACLVCCIHGVGVGSPHLPPRDRWYLNCSAPSAFESLLCFPPARRFLRSKIEGMEASVKAILTEEKVRACGGMLLYFYVCFML